jgi:hypothetical protein
MAIFDTNNVEQPPVSYHPNETLAAMIADAWLSETFKTHLLTFSDPDVKAEWTGPADYSKQYAIFYSKKVHITKPVVLSKTQYDLGYRKADDGEVVFVLPDDPTNKVETMDHALETARVQMAATTAGM